MVQRSGIDTIKYHTWPRIPMGKWQTHRRHHKREPRGQPFPSRWPQSTYKQTRTKHSKHKTEQKHKRSQEWSMGCLSLIFPDNQKSMTQNLSSAAVIIGHSFYLPLQESLDEVTVKDMLEGDNMYTCSKCQKKVRAEKRWVSLNPLCTNEFFHLA